MNRALFLYLKADAALLKLNTPLDDVVRLSAGFFDVFSNRAVPRSLMLF